MEIIPSSDARARGLKLYFTGKPCKRGHITARRVSTLQCTECVRAQAIEWKIKTSYGRSNAHAKCVKKWSSKNRDKINASSRRRLPQNAAKEARRRARKKNSVGAFTPDDVSNIIRMQRGKCAVCGIPLKKDRHVDHIMPLSLGGSNWPSNLQVTCGLSGNRCNIRKKDKHPIDFMRENGRLL